MNPRTAWLPSALSLIALVLPWGALRVVVHRLVDQQDLVPPVTVFLVTLALAAVTLALIGTRLVTWRESLRNLVSNPVRVFVVALVAAMAFTSTGNLLGQQVTLVEWLGDVVVAALLGALAVWAMNRYLRRDVPDSPKGLVEED